jgi:hypothetical protein
VCCANLDCTSRQQAGIAAEPWWRHCCTGPGAQAGNPCTQQRGCLLKPPCIDQLHCRQQALLLLLQLLLLLLLHSWQLSCKLRVSTWRCAWVLLLHVAVMVAAIIKTAI